MAITISETREIDSEQVVALYKANKWSAADKPNALQNALLNAHSLITAWDKDKLIGVGNAISDGFWSSIILIY